MLIRKIVTLCFSFSYVSTCFGHEAAEQYTVSIVIYNTRYL